MGSPDYYGRFSNKMTVNDLMTKESFDWSGPKGALAGGLAGATAGAITDLAGVTDRGAAALGGSGVALGALLGYLANPRRLTDRIARNEAALDRLDAIKRDVDTTENEKNLLLLRPTLEKRLERDLTKLEKRDSK